MKSYTFMQETCLFLSSTALAAASIPEFAATVENILTRPTFQYASVGIEARVFHTNELIYALNEKTPLIPASNQKIVTSTVALSTLGPDWNYTTSVVTNSPIGSNGTLGGDIWLVGSGDPSLDSSRLAILAKDFVARTGIKEITGNVYGDGTIFDRRLLGEGWSPSNEPFPYSAQVAGINCDLNVVNVTVSAGASIGDNAAIQVNGLDLQDERYVSIDSSVQTVSSCAQTSVSFDRVRGTNKIVLGGSVAKGAPVTLRITIDDPTAFAAYRFALALRMAGVLVSSMPTEVGKAPHSSRELASSTSAPLSVLLGLFMKPSDNMYGEALLKTISHHEDPSEPGSAAIGAQVVFGFLEEAGLNDTGITVVDGSGLSRLNTLTAAYLVNLLSHNRRSLSQDDWTIYFNSFPIGGVDGTLATRFTGSPVAGRVRGKTGSLTGVSSLSGYLQARDGTEYIFSMLMNNITDTTEARQSQDDIVTALFDLDSS